MNSLSVTDSSEDLRLASKSIDPLEEHWFDATPPSGRGRPSAPPVVRVGEFLGDPEVDAWLR
ncbi:MAG: hypothetical protein BGO98_20330 [Myxococcales bacterium 68-20]|nr:hypothetical protein [Myxococcales bacterium]OJY24221.1 MAG: hypothetical protein BGO98_20330 [Myxococcales bacterium 68-20]